MPLINWPGLYQGPRIAAIHTRRLRRLRNAPKKPAPAAAGPVCSRPSSAIFFGSRLGIERGRKNPPAAKSAGSRPTTTHQASSPTNRAGAVDGSFHVISFPGNPRPTRGFFGQVWVAFSALRGAPQVDPDFLGTEAT